MSSKPEDSSPKKGFSYWFENVFKYHYGKLAILLLAIAAVVIYNIIDSRNSKIEYDFNMAITVEGGVSYTSLSELEDLAKKTVGDINGDGEVHVNIQLINLGNDGSDSQYRLMLLMALPENVVFIMDDHYSSVYAKDFNDLNDYGIASDEKIRQRVYIGNTPIMDRINSEIEFYACLADWTTDGKGNPDWTAAGVKVIKAILDN